MFGTWVNPNAPDVILEVGPHPCSTRYAAHAALLATHSGYLRAALRTLDQHHSNTTGPLRRVVSQHSGISATSEICSLPSTTNTTSLLYLPNVTPEQFTPLLSYMYTGYLDLTMDNIFGVLLATHLLHMPRALELCRTYLSSSASATNTSTCTSISGDHLQRSYFAPKPNTIVAATAFSAANSTSKLVRPIASKALATVGLNFIAPPTASQINLLPSASFRSLGATSQDISSEHPEEESQHEAHSPSQSPISVTRYEEEEESITHLTPQGSPLLECDTKDVVSADHNSKESKSKPEELKHPNNSSSALPEALDDENRTKNHQIAYTKRQKIQQQDVTNDGANGVIIDIASCDGPVRFRRVLNVMYGCNNNTRTVDSTDTSKEAAFSFADAGSNVKRKVSCSLRYASSFHQQMARNISNTGKLAYESSSSSSNSSCQKYQHLQTQLQPVAASHFLLSQDEEQKDENSQEDIAPCNTESTTDAEGNSSYTCVYCKHTFKSHYCYQKHAKRHLIPLCLDNKPTATYSSASTVKSVSHAASHPRGYDTRRRSHQNSTTNSSSTNTIKREVKPLDMNVQYYPCKTCGSKFPSYYFVHKHRKLCHTEEEDDTTNLSTSTASNITSVNISKESSHEAKAFQPEPSTEAGKRSDFLANVDHNPLRVEQQ